MMISSMTCLTLALVIATAMSCASAQPFVVSANFAAKLGEAAQREQIKYAGLIYDFNKDPSKGTPNGKVQTNQVGQNPFLSTLPGDGNGQTLLTLGPCAGNIIHSHPRGSEISYVVKGNITFGFVEENAAKPPNAPITFDMVPGQTIHVPQGLLHFTHNPTCEPAQFLANFGQADPGTQTTWASFINIPSAILHLSTGIPEATWAKLKTTYPLVTAPGTGGEACLKLCGLDFTKENTLTPNA